LSGYIFATKALIHNRKKLVKQQYGGPLAAEIGPVIWGIPAKLNGFRILAALLHSTVVLAVSQTAALNRGRHLYSVGRPSRWALAHISSFASIGLLQISVGQSVALNSHSPSVSKHMPCQVISPLAMMEWHSTTSTVSTANFQVNLV